MDNIRLSGLIEESIVDGVGIRTTVFTQGCPHHCVGCHNPATHDFEGGYLQAIDEILAKIQNNPLIDGVTVSGGEPFAQPAATLALVDGVERLGKNVWIYSGYTFEQLCAMRDPTIGEILSRTDVLVDGPFVLAQRDLSLRFRGSRNQRLVLCKKSLVKKQVILFD